MPNEKEGQGYQRVWQTPPTCESCPLFIPNATGVALINGEAMDGYCARETFRSAVQSQIHWCGSHPQHAAMLAILAQAAAERIAKPSGRNGLITSGGLNLG